MPKPFEMEWAFKTTTNQKILCVLVLLNALTMPNYFIKTFLTYP